MGQHIVYLFIIFLQIFIELCPCQDEKELYPNLKRIKRWESQSGISHYIGTSQGYYDSNYNGEPSDRFFSGHVQPKTDNANTQSNWGYQSRQNPSTRKDYNAYAPWNHGSNQAVHHEHPIPLRVHDHVFHQNPTHNNEFYYVQPFYQPPSLQFNEDYERGFHHGFYQALSYHQRLPHPTSLDHHNNAVPVTVGRDDGSRASGKTNPIPLKVYDRLETTTENEITHYLSNLNLDNIQPLKFNDRPEMSSEIGMKPEMSKKKLKKPTKDSDDDISYMINKSPTSKTNIENLTISDGLVAIESVNTGNDANKIIKLQNVYLNTELPSENPCDDYEPKKPAFFALGLKTNEIICREYIWEARRNELREPRPAACQKKKDREAGVFSIAVFGGDDAELGDFPHMGAIGWKAIDDTDGLWVFKCGCTLISHNFVLTAAHCTHIPLDSTISETDPKIVRLGDKNIIENASDGENDFKIIRSIVHPDYASPKKYNDIALMELEKKVEFSTLIRPACLWNAFDTSMLPYQPTVTGWGAVESAKQIISPNLQVAKLEVIDREICDELLRPSRNRNFDGVYNSQICGGNLTGGVDTCQGDSGGPFQVNLDLPEDMSGSMHYVLGITSFGIGCGKPNTPAVYTSVSYFAEWIEKNVWPDEII